MERSSEIRRLARVLLVDDSIFVLEGLRAILSKGRHLVVVGTARTTAAASAAVQTCQPDVVVLDVQVGKASGIDLCRAIRQGYPHIAVLFFTAHAGKHLFQSAILAGAQGYLLKHASGEDILKGIEDVSAGRAIVDQRLTQQLFRCIRDGRRITQRERMKDSSGADLQVLSLLAAGKTNKEIAQQLDVAPSILGARVRTIYKRLSVSRRSEAAACFVQWEKESLAG